MVNPEITNLGDVAYAEYHGQRIALTGSMAYVAVSGKLVKRKIVAREVTEELVGEDLIVSAKYRFEGYTKMYPGEKVYVGTIAEVKELYVKNLVNQMQVES